MNNNGLMNVGDVMKYIGKLDSYIEDEFVKLKKYANEKNFFECSACLSKIDELRHTVMDLKLMEVKNNE